MSVLKGLNRSDVYITDYNARKRWSISGSELNKYNIRFMKAVSGSIPYYFKEEDLVPFVEGQPESGSYNARLLFEQIKALYYTGSQGDGTFYGPQDWTLQTTLTVTGSRVLNDRVWKDARDEESDLPDGQKNHDQPGVVVISIPKNLIGTGITPNSLNIDLKDGNQCYVEDDYVDTTGSFDDEGYPPGTYTIEETHWVDPYFENLHTGTVRDYEGVLIYSGFVGTWSIKPGMDYPSPDREENKVVGDTIYSQGQIIITNEFLKYLVSNWDTATYGWESSNPIFTEHVICRLRDIEFNKTFNPSATEDLQNRPEFTPYITTVGLYDSVGNLLAVAKLSKPIKKGLDIDMTFDLQIDLG